MIKYNPRIRIFPFLISLYSERLTSSGRALFWVLLLSSLLGLYTFTIKIYLVFISLFCLFSTTIILSRLFLPKLSISYFPPSRTTAGFVSSFKVILKNITRREYYDIFVKVSRLPKGIKISQNETGYIPFISAGENAEAIINLEFNKRGHYKLHGIDVLTSFPFGLWRARRRYREEKSLLVYPEFKPLNSLSIPVGRKYQPGGIALTSSLGDSTEFISTKEYREGDNPRNIHWRSFARLGKPVVKEFQEEYFCRIALLLDTYIPPGVNEKALAGLESAISLSAAIADNLSKQEYIIDIFAAGPDIYYLQAGRSLAYLENILDILACLEHTEKPPFEKLEPVLLSNLSQITTCIMVFLDWDESREKLIRTTYNLGTALKVIIVRDKKPTVDPLPYEDITGRITWISSYDARNGVENI